MSEPNPCKCCCRRIAGEEFSGCGNRGGFITKLKKGVEQVIKLVLAFLLLFGLLMTFGYFFPSGSNPEDDLGTLSTKFSCQSKGEMSSVRVLGQVRNKGEKKYGNIYFTTALLDSSRNTLDGFSDNICELYVSPDVSRTFVLEYESPIKCEKIKEVQVHATHGQRRPRCRPL
jgi:hypothetical protein